MCIIVDVYLTRPQNIFRNDYWQCLSRAAAVLLGNQSHSVDVSESSARFAQTDIVLAASAARSRRYRHAPTRSPFPLPHPLSHERSMVRPGDADRVRQWKIREDLNLNPKRSEYDAPSACECACVYELPHPVSLSIRSRAFPGNWAPRSHRLIGAAVSPNQALCVLKDKRQDLVPDPFPHLFTRLNDLSGDFTLNHAQRWRR